VTSKSNSYSYYIVIKRTVYSFYNVYSNDLSVLYRVLNKKRCFNIKECETALLFHNTTFKLLHLKD